MIPQEESGTSETIQLSHDDVAFLFSLLRDPAVPQPVTTQQMIDALRSRSRD